MAPRAAPINAGSPPDAPPPLADQAPDFHRKTLRSFLCRDALWSDLEQLANELECSVDYLVTESLKQYLRRRNALQATDASLAAGPAAPALPADGTLVPPDPVTPHTDPPDAIRGEALRPPGSEPHTDPPDAVRGEALSPPTTDPHTEPPDAVRGDTLGAPASDPHTPSPDALRGETIGSLAPPLVAISQGQRYPVTTDRFLIGGGNRVVELFLSFLDRGKKPRGLLFNEPDMSRHHALIERINGIYYITHEEYVDGTDPDDQSSLRKQIMEGDVFCLGGCQVSFTYKDSA